MAVGDQHGYGEPDFRTTEPYADVAGDQSRASAAQEVVVVDDRRRCRRCRGYHRRCGGDEHERRVVAAFRRWPRRLARVGAVVKRAALLMVLIAACKSAGEPSSFGLNVRIEATSLDTGTRAQIVKAALHVTGDETYDTSLDVAKYIGGGEVRFRYLPGIRSGVLTIAVDALAADGAILASGSNGPLTVTDRGIDVPVVLGAPAIADMASPDLSPLGPGAACTSANQCATAGGCVDGYCCDSTCTGACTACNLAGKQGTCTAVGAGFMPSAGHASCGPDPASSCMRNGACDGAGACQLYAAGTVCAASMCASGAYTPKSACDGTGGCKTPTTIPCAPFVCQDTTTCYSTCSSNTQCTSPNTCSNPGASGSCGLKSLGAPCGADGQCSSGFCAPEGICCNQACTGQCQYCEGGTGACKYTSGAPASPRSACTGQGTAPCGGACNGLGAACVYPSTVTTCGPTAGCGRSSFGALLVFVPQEFCSGSGTCVYRDEPFCDPYGCNDLTGCYTSCTSDAQCDTLLNDHCIISNGTCGK